MRTARPSDDSEFVFTREVFMKSSHASAHYQAFMNRLKVQCWLCTRNKPRLQSHHENRLRLAGQNSGSSPSHTQVTNFAKSTHSTMRISLSKCTLNKVHHIHDPLSSGHDSASSQSTSWISTKSTKSIPRKSSARMALTAAICLPHQPGGHLGDELC